MPSAGERIPCSARGSWICRRAEAPSALLATAAPPGTRTWAALDDDPELRRAYWQSFRWIQVETGALATALTALLTNDRPTRAVRLAAYALHPNADDTTSMTPDLATLVLDGLRDAETRPDPLPHDIGYEVGVILDYLAEEDVATDTIAAYEFAFHGLLHDDRPPRALAQALDERPELYVELLSRVFRSKSGPTKESTPDEAKHAAYAWRVLNDWDRLPGLRDDGSLDAEHLTDWVKRARALLADADRGDIGDEQIGAILATAPFGRDGAWPHEAVRDLVETVGNTRIKTGIHVGCHNAQGVTSRSLYAGGNIERNEAARYRAWAQQMGPEHRRMASVLRRLADSYDDEARREDKRAEQDQDSD